MLKLSTPDAPASAVRREGDLVYIPRLRPGAKEGVALPPLCVKCGAPPTAWLRRKYYWHTPWIYLVLLLNVLVFAIVAMIVRKWLHVNVPLCATHAAGRRKQLAVAWGLAAAGMVLPFVLIAVGLPAWLGFLMVVLVPVGVVVGVRSNPLTPRRIDEAGGKFKGASAAFLDGSVF